MIETMFGVFALAMLELSAAIPLGLHLKLHPGLLIATAATGALTGAVAAMFLGTGIRRLMFWRKSEKAEGGRVSRWLLAKGPWAIGLLGPLLIGPVLSAGLAGAIGLPRKFSLLLLAAGIVLWSVTFTLLGSYGIAALR
jgi:membrane protein YqaA with SNARE-associated domain